MQDRRYISLVKPVAASLALVLAALAGCGALPSLSLDAASDAAYSLEPSACERSPDPETAGTLMVIDWTGGMSDLVADRELSAFDTDALLMTDVDSGGRETPEAFQQAVLARVQVILCALDPMDLAVIAGEAEDFPNATIVHVTGDAPVGGGKHIGQSRFDPCNSSPADAIIVWGGAIATRVGAASVDEWVNAFANTAAHEIGHTLGFVHPGEDTVGAALPLPTDELMLGNVTVSNLLIDRRFVLEQNTCPQDPARSYHLIN
jgi:hypothetical protein